ncbi:MAG TPA: hypothetical protein VKT78_15535 [Fimbriimonadaceae bacterium]|nr:hypothetical protein [Fimbriimonadaceae bacterium]
MKTNQLRTTLLAAAALACLIPAAAQAQRYREYVPRANNLSDEVFHTFRDSKDFRHYFEHHFRANGHEPRWDRSDRYGHPEHEDRFGRMSLKDAIQNLDEDIERLRAEFAHHGASRAAVDLADEIRDHSDQVDRRIGRVGEWYRFDDDRDWHWDRSELFNRWRDLRTDIREVTGDMLRRR